MHPIAGDWSFSNETAAITVVVATCDTHVICFWLQSRLIGQCQTISATAIRFHPHISSKQSCVRILYCHYFCCGTAPVFFTCILVTEWNFWHASPQNLSCVLLVGSCEPWHELPISCVPVVPHQVLSASSSCAVVWFEAIECDNDSNKQLQQTTAQMLTCLRTAAQALSLSTLLAHQQACESMQHTSLCTLNLLLNDWKEAHRLSCDLYSSCVWVYGLCLFALINLLLIWGHRRPHREVIIVCESA